MLTYDDNYVYIQYYVLQHTGNDTDFILSSVGASRSTLT